jgi:branched-subunit amino acid aminotransferase/4-amino-4-deoxychorismate lyase
VPIIEFRTPSADLSAAMTGKELDMSRIWSNGEWIGSDDFRVAQSDRNLLHGLGLFETLLAIDGRPVFVERHFARLKHGCELLGWPLERQGLRDAMVKLLRINRLSTGRARIRLTLTAGSGKPDNLVPGADRLLWMGASAIGEPPPAVTVCIAPYPRNEHSPLAGMKCASYAENLIALDQARRAGFGETLFFNTAGHLCEAATANVFLVKDGALLTPSLDSGCLPGITRGVVIEIASSLGIPCRETRLVRDDLPLADEIFLTSSTRGPVAVVRIGDQPIAAGETTVALTRAWSDLARRDAAG